MNPIPDGAIPSHQPRCLGCGTENPGSMGLRLRAEDGRILGKVTFDQRHEGAPGFAHGGAVATVLDDTMGTVLLIIERPAVTANLNTDFRTPALLGRELDVEGWCEKIEGRKLHLAGRLLDGENVIAEASALFIEVELDHFRKGGADLPDRWLTWTPECKT